MQCFFVENEFNALPDRGYTKDHASHYGDGRISGKSLLLQNSNSSASYDPPVLPTFLKTSHKNLFVALYLP